jgi:putative ABC transport system substrate-binding protein
MSADRKNFTPTNDTIVTSSYSSFSSFFSFLKSPLYLASSFFLYIGLFITLHPVAIASNALKVIAITQIVSHPSADETRKGVIDSLKEQGYEEGKNLKIIYENPEGNMATAVQIAQKFVSLKPDVIVAITTPSAQAIVSASKNSDIPVVFASVTDPLYAKIVPSLKKPGGMVTGATDTPPVEAQMTLIQKIVPSIKALGVIYNPGEVNSANILSKVEKHLKILGIKVIAVASHKTNDVPSAAHSLMGKVEAIYISLDNTALSAMDSILKIAFKNKIPVFSSDPNSVGQGALAALSHTQYQSGKLGGVMVARILQGEKPGDIAVSTPKKAELHINVDSAKSLDIEIPEEILKKADKLVSVEKKNPKN